MNGGNLFCCHKTCRFQREIMNNFVVACCKAALRMMETNSRKWLIKGNFGFTELEVKVTSVPTQIRSSACSCQFNIFLSHKSQVHTYTCIRTILAIIKVETFCAPSQPNIFSLWSICWIIMWIQRNFGPLSLSLNCLQGVKMYSCSAFKDLSILTQAWAENNLNEEGAELRFNRVGSTQCCLRWG